MNLLNKLMQFTKIAVIVCIMLGFQKPSLASAEDQSNPTTETVIDENLQEMETKNQCGYCIGNWDPTTDEEGRSIYYASTGAVNSVAGVIFCVVGSVTNCSTPVLASALGLVGLETLYSIPCFLTSEACRKGAEHFGFNDFLESQEKARSYNNKIRKQNYAEQKERCNTFCENYKEGCAHCLKPFCGNITKKQEYSEI